MKESVCPPFSRAKAVWGPKRWVASAALLAVSLGFVADASAQGRHSRQAPRLRPGSPDTFVKRDKMDTEVSKRAYGLNRLATADVIVTLENGVDLPLAYQRYS